MIPTPEQILDLRKRHHITQNQLADSLYGIKRERIGDWESGRRACPSIIWWAILLTWDKRDLWEEEH
jgi:DNA-binding XRE family transcriptional regulator